jgi:phytoene dehydrogenase-like protein
LTLPGAIRERAERRAYDALVVGSGPNGLGAAVTLARAGRSVLLLERDRQVGGGAGSAELTLPGFIHDRCSAIHPLGVSSPLFRSLPLLEHGLDWIFPPAELAHPFDGGSAATLKRSIAETAAGLGRDGAVYRSLMTPFVSSWPQLEANLLGPTLLPRHPLALAQFAAVGLFPAGLLARVIFQEDRTRALFAGLAAHSMLSLRRPGTAAFGLVLGLLGHVAGWPLPRGGSQRISDALASYLRSLGGEILTEAPVTSLADLPPASSVLFDVTPRQLLLIAGESLPSRYRHILARYRYGAAAFKVDWALSGPVPWSDPQAHRAATVHLGATLREILASEAQVASGRPPDRPFVLAAQQSLFDPSRAPAGKHTLWAYCHVPNGSPADMTARIEAQVERFAPGFRDLILARHVTTPADFEAHNPNYVGGDINGGMADLRQMVARPALSVVPYAVPGPSRPRLYLCSASTPPGGGVHGMCGYYAARAAMAGTDGIAALRNLRSWRGEPK